MSAVFSDCGGNKKRATCFATMLQNELNSDVARCTTHVQTCLQPDLLQNRFDVGDKTRNIAIQRVLQQCCKIGCRFFIARFSVKHESLRICWSPTLHKITATTHLYARSIKGLLFAHFLIGSVIGSYLLTTLKSWHATVSKIF